MRQLHYYFRIILFLFAATKLQAQNTGFKLPAYEKFTLKNGLVIYLMEQHEVPLVNVSVVIPAGAIYDGSQSGLATLTALALRHGTKNISKSKMEQELDFAGATVNTFASKESAGLIAKFAVKDRDKILDIIKEVLLNPTFNPEEFEKERKRALVGLEQAQESPRSVIPDYFNGAVYGNHVYANPVNGQISTVGKLTVQDAERFYESYYMPNGSAIAVVGDFRMKEMKSVLSKLFEPWARGTATGNVADKPINLPQAPQVLLVNKDDASETTFYIGGPGIRRSNPDYVAIEVVNTVLGGRFTSWLNDELRVNTGLTYGALSGFTPLKNSGTFRVYTFTATKNTEAAIDKTLEVMKRLHEKGIDEATLASAKNYVKGQYPPNYETAGQLAALLTQMFWYGFDESFINNFQKNVADLTVAKAKEIIAKYFPEKNLQFVLVGKADDIRKTASKYGKVTEVQIKDDGGAKPKAAL